MDTAVWGRDAWFVLENLCAESGAPLAQAALIKSLLCLCPCTLCARSARIFAELIPFEAIARSEEPALLWIWRLHNWVNLKLSKPLFPYAKLRKRAGLNIDPEPAVGRLLLWVGGYKPSFKNPAFKAMLAALGDLLRKRPSSVTLLGALTQAPDQTAFLNALRPLLGRNSGAMQHMLRTAKA